MKSLITVLKDYFQLSTAVLSAEYKAMDAADKEWYRQEFIKLGYDIAPLKS